MQCSYATQVRAYIISRVRADLLRTFVSSSIKIALSFPAFVAIVFGLLQAGKETDFQTAHPDLYDHLVDFINSLLAFLVEHWVFWIILSASLGYVWALIVAEPKAESKRKFDVQRKKRLP